MSGSEIVHQAAGMATLPLSDPPKTFLLPFSKNQHLVPESAIISFPKKANKVASPEALGALLATKAPEKWLQYCKPNTLCRIQGETGNCVYTTFQVDGHPGEERILRNIAPAIAEKNFKEIKLTEKPPPEGANDRQKIRYEVLNWTKAVDCPSRAQISPEIEKWPVADLTEAQDHAAEADLFHPPQQLCVVVAARPRQAPADEQLAGLLLRGQRREETLRILGPRRRRSRQQDEGEKRDDATAAGGHPRIVSPSRRDSVDRLNRLRRPLRRGCWQPQGRAAPARWGAVAARRPDTRR